MSAPIHGFNRYFMMKIPFKPSTIPKRGGPNLRRRNTISWSSKQKDLDSTRKYDCTACRRVCTGLSPPYSISGKRNPNWRCIQLVWRCVECVLPPVWGELGKESLVRWTSVQWGLQKPKRTKILRPQKLHVYWRHWVGPLILGGLNWPMGAGTQRSHCWVQTVQQKPLQVLQGSKTD